jgi:MFS family permease
LFLKSNVNMNSKVNNSNYKFFYGWVIAICSTLIVMMNGGIFFTFSVFFIPVAKYFNWSRNEISLNYTAMLVAYAPGAYFAGKLAERYGPRRILLFVALLIGIGFVGCYLANNLAIMILSYFIIGLGLGGTLVIPTAIVQRWFFKLRGLAVGLVIAGNGIGGLIFAPLANHLITVYGWQTSYLIIGIIYGGVIAISALLMLANPAIKKLRPYGYEGDYPLSHHQQGSSNYGLSYAFRDSTFWWTTILYILNFIPLFFISSHLVPYIAGKRISTAIGAQGLGLIAAMSVIGRLAMGWVGERIGWLKVEAICLFVASLSLVLLMFVTGVASFYLFVIIYGLSAGSTLAVLGGATGFFFGLTNLSEILGFQLGIGVLFGAILPWAGGLIYDLTGSYLITLIISIGVFIAGGIIALWLKPNKRGRQPSEIQMQ